MNSLNSVLVEGSLVDRPVYYTNMDGIPECNFVIVTEREREGEKESHSFPVQVCGPLAKSCKNNLGRGSKVRLIGRLEQDRWTTPNGNFVVKIVAEHVEFVPGIKPQKTAADIESEVVEEWRNELNTLYKER